MEENFEEVTVIDFKKKKPKKDKPAEKGKSIITQKRKRKRKSNRNKKLIMKSDTNNYFTGSVILSLRTILIWVSVLLIRS